MPGRQTNILIVAILMSSAGPAASPVTAQDRDDRVRYYDYDDPYSDFFENYYHYNLPPVDRYDARNDTYDPYIATTRPLPAAGYDRVRSRYPESYRYFYRGGPAGAYGQGAYPVYPSADAADGVLGDAAPYSLAEFHDYFNHADRRLYDVDYSEFGYDYPYDAGGLGPREGYFKGYYDDAYNAWYNAGRYPSVPGYGYGFARDRYGDDDWYYDYYDRTGAAAARTNWFPGYDPDAEKTLFDWRSTKR